MASYAVVAATYWTGVLACHVTNRIDGSLSVVDEEWWHSIAAAREFASLPCLLCATVLTKYRVPELLARDTRLWTRTCARDAGKYTICFRYSSDATAQPNRRRLSGESIS